MTVPQHREGATLNATHLTFSLSMFTMHFTCADYIPLHVRTSRMQAIRNPAPDERSETRSTCAVKLTQHVEMSLLRLLRPCLKHLQGAPQTVLSDSPDTFNINASFI